MQEDIVEKFYVCGCGNVLGCVQNGTQRSCELTQPGDVERTFGCDVKKFYCCTTDKDELLEENRSEMIFVVGGTCRHCPPADSDHFLPEDERGPIAFLSSEE